MLPEKSSLNLSYFRPMTSHRLPWHFFAHHLVVCNSSKSLLFETPIIRKRKSYPSGNKKKTVEKIDY